MSVNYAILKLITDISLMKSAELTGLCGKKVFSQLIDQFSTFLCLLISIISKL